MAFAFIIPSFSIKNLAASFIITIFCLGFPRTAEAAVRGNETDQEALLSFKDGLTSDLLGALRSWNQSVHFCQWGGVTCGRRHQRVVALHLDHQQLRGAISPHIGNLSFLRVFSLRNNSMEKQIPPELGRLRRLQILLLRNNSLRGEIPVNLSTCSNLVKLDLTGNNLEGAIPSNFGYSLSKLDGLYVGRNNLGGTIPSTLANISSLRIFYASVNNIHGSIPNQFGQLKVLEEFIVSSNKLVGTIPASLFNISSMKRFVLQNNTIRGSLPSQLGGTIFPSLDMLDLGGNLFQGSIPVSISNASGLGYLDLSLNTFTGEVPPMDKLQYLQFLNLQDNSLGTAGRVDDLSFMSSLTNTTVALVLLDDNQFGGRIPRSISNFSATNLVRLYLHNNEISGSIPGEIGNLVSLQDLQLFGNKFTGNIPSTIGMLNELRLLDLSRNMLNGIIPPSFGNLTLLIKLIFDQNNLQGTIPSSLGKCRNLLILSLFSCNLHGTIPREIFFLSSLVSLDLHQNHFTGSIPTEIGGLLNLEELLISNNLLSGEVPTSLGRCVYLTTLDMGNNSFGGTLPASLSSLKGLEALNLSHNNFSGNVPDYLEAFKVLHYLNLSFNNFEGAIPERGIFKNATLIDVQGNTKLCGGVPQLQLPHCKSKASKIINMKLVIVLVVCITIAILLLCFLYLYLSSKSKKEPQSPHPTNPFLNLSYQNLLEATNRFSPASLIGVGSFGSVYKGILDEGQKIVAVKVLNLQRRGASRSFMAECEALRRIRHRNLVKVLTACSSIDHQGNDFKALIYEFMAKGSLDDWLHSHDIQNEMQDDSRNLNISQRLDIALDVGYALEYLHHRCEEPIVHCDLKPSNILLDDDMVGHVGDFGLAKFLPEHELQSSESQSSTIGVRGSVGYVAPEYGIGNEVSALGDVYSYGIVLLEMFTGKRPTDHHKFNGCLNLHEYVKAALPEKVADIADPLLFIQPTRDDDEISTRRSNTQNQGFTSNETLKDCLTSLLEVGIACSKELARDRITINEAISQLHTIKKGLLGTGGRVRLEMQSEGRDIHV